MKRTFSNCVTKFQPMTDHCSFLYLAVFHRYGTGNVRYSTLAMEAEPTKIATRNANFRKEKDTEHDTNRIIEKIIIRLCEMRYGERIKF